MKKAGLELFDTVLDIFNSKKVLRSMAAEALVSIMKQMPPDVFTAELGRWRREGGRLSAPRLASLRSLWLLLLSRFSPGLQRPSWVLPWAVPSLRCAR